MESSRRAVESYWRSRMIDGATSDEDKITPVYKLEEICDLLRSSHSSIVKEVSEFILKRLQNKSPIVKQKALRVIKYAVGKSGAEFRREMQRNSAAVRQLIHYKGQSDPLKGDALNKSVRETAQETLSALFSSSEDNKPTPTENLSGRIQGFGNTNYEMPSEDKKSFLSEVVGIGSSTIRQGFSNFTQSSSFKKNESASYRGPNIQRSLTVEKDYSDRYDGVKLDSETYSSSSFARNGGSGNWIQGIQKSQVETSDVDSVVNNTERTREQRLLETVVSSGGVRLLPTRDTLQVFLVEAAKLDALALSHALEQKLQSPLWQVRVKAVCVLEAILRKKDVAQFSIITSYFSENKDVMVKCSESPQATLREKANKVLSILDVEQNGQQDKPVKAEITTVQLPDLIDTGDPDYLFGAEDSVEWQSEKTAVNPLSSTTPISEQTAVSSAVSAPLIDDLFGDTINTSAGANELKSDDDPFSDVAFLTSNDKAQESDLFSGMTVDKVGSAEADLRANGDGSDLFDAFGSSTEVKQGNVHELMDGLSLNGNDFFEKHNIKPERKTSENVMSSDTRSAHQVSNAILNNILTSQAAGTNVNSMFPLGAMGYNFPAGFLFNPSFTSHPVNHANATGVLPAHQQFLATISSFQQFGNPQPNNGINLAAGSAGVYTSPLPDIFNPSMPNQALTSTMTSSKKEETKAFDFISDHLAAARDPKRPI